MGDYLVMHFINALTHTPRRFQDLDRHGLHGLDIESHGTNTTSHDELTKALFAKTKDRFVVRNARMLNPRDFELAIERIEQDNADKPWDKFDELAQLLREPNLQRSENIVLVETIMQRIKTCLQAEVGLENLTADDIRLTKNALEGVIDYYHSRPKGDPIALRILVDCIQLTGDRDLSLSTKAAEILEARTQGIAGKLSSLSDSLERANIAFAKGFNSPNANLDAYLFANQGTKLAASDSKASDLYLLKAKTLYERLGLKDLACIDLLDGISTTGDTDRRLKTQLNSYRSQIYDESHRTGTIMGPRASLNADIYELHQLIDDDPTTIENYNRLADIAPEDPMSNGYRERINSLIKQVDILPQLRNGMGLIEECFDGDNLDHHYNDIEGLYPRCCSILASIQATGEAADIEDRVSQRFTGDYDDLGSSIVKSIRFTTQKSF